MAAVPHTYGALMRRPGYAGFLGTVWLSRLTGSMFITTGVLLVLVRTGSTALAGGTAAVGTVTWAVMAPIGGAWLDVAHHRRALIVLDHALTVVGLIAMVLLAGHAPGWTLLADSVLLSVTRPFSVGGFFSAIAELAGADLLDLASNLEATSMNLSFVVGPALAGVIAGAIGAAAAIWVQAGLTAVAGLAIAGHRVFDVRAADRAASAREALAAGFRALRSEPVLMRTACSSMLAMFGWGLMIVGFPIYAVGVLHAGAHASGYLWAGIGLGSMVGTFALAGRPTLRRVGASYAVLGLSALLWPLAATLWLGVLLITVTGFLEGPAYSGTIALRQRFTPPAVRASTHSSINAATLLANAAGSALAGLVHRTWVIVACFVAINLAAGALAASPLSRRSRPR